MEVTKEGDLFPNNGDSYVEYKEGDSVFIIKNSDKRVVDFRESSLKEINNIKIFKKDLESENCISLGFTYTRTAQDDAVIMKLFNKDFNTCTEQYIRDNIPITRNYNVIFFIRKI